MLDVSKPSATVSVLLQIIAFEEREMMVAAQEHERAVDALKNLEQAQHNLAVNVRSHLRVTFHGWGDQQTRMLSRCKSLGHALSGYA
jgi:hypothetical protein